MAKTIRQFVAFEWARPKKHKYSFKVFEVKRNKLLFIDRWEFSYGSTRWPESEVMRVLREWKHIPQKYTWYYDEHYGKNFAIRYIQPDDQH